MKNSQTSLPDVSLTNSSSLLCNTITFNCGLGDCHNIRATIQKKATFSSKPVDQPTVTKATKKLNPKKTTGVDQLPAKLIKAGSQALVGPIRPRKRTFSLKIGK